MAIDLYKFTEVELVYRSKVKASERPKVTSSREAYHLLRQHWDEDKIEFIEQSKVILLNRAARVLGIYEASSGGTSGTVVDAKQIFVAAIKANASSIILAHNHPSSNTKPSEADLRLTKKLCAAGKVLDVDVLDHIIVTKDHYYSFADHGVLSL